MRQTFKTTAVAATAALVVVVVTGGCAKDPARAGHAHAGHHGYHEHPIDRMPAAVRAAVRRDYPSAQVVSAGSEFADADESAHYHVKVRTADGRTVDAEYDGAGRKLAD